MLLFFSQEKSVNVPKKDVNNKTTTLPKISNDFLPGAVSFYAILQEFLFPSIIFYSLIIKSYLIVFH